MTNGERLMASASIELLTIGTELLLGFTVDTNSAEIGQLLAASGVQLVRRTAVADREVEIREAVSQALQRTGALITTGGLGPTRDDITKKVVADLFGVPLEFHEPIWQGLVERFARLGRNLAATNRCQAEVPRGAVVLPNRWGTAPGLWLEAPLRAEHEGAPRLAILLPGVPREMRGLMAHEVIPRLAQWTGSTATVIRSALLRTTGVPESRLAERVGDIERELAPLSLAFLPSLSGVDLRLTAWDLPAAEAERRLGEGVAALRERVGEFTYAEGDTDLAAVVLQGARAAGLHLAVAESCTGGLLGARITAIPGSSDVFAGGVIAYDNAVKIRELGVPAELIESNGAVSEPVVRAMAEGAARRFGVEASLAVTGIAGPGGGSPSKPVGTVWYGLRLSGRTEAVSYVFPGEREEVRARAAQGALFLLLGRLREGSR